MLLTKNVSAMLNIIIILKLINIHVVVVVICLFVFICFEEKSINIHNYLHRGKSINSCFPKYALVIYVFRVDENINIFRDLRLCVFLS